LKSREACKVGKVAVDSREVKKIQDLKAMGTGESKHISTDRCALELQVLKSREACKVGKVAVDMREAIKMQYLKAMGTGESKHISTDGCLPKSNKVAARLPIATRVLGCSSPRVRRLKSSRCYTSKGHYISSA